MSAAKRVPPSGHHVASVSRSSVTGELKALRSNAANLKKDPAKVRELAVRAGIITSAGKLTKPFGGKR